MKKLTINYNTVGAHNPCPAGAARYSVAMGRMRKDLYDDVPLTELARHIDFVADDFVWWMSKMGINIEHLLRLGLDITTMHAGLFNQAAIDHWLANPSEGGAEAIAAWCLCPVVPNDTLHENMARQMLHEMARCVRQQRTILSALAYVLDASETIHRGETVEKIVEWLEDLEFHGVNSWKQPHAPEFVQLLGRGTRVWLGWRRV